MELHYHLTESDYRQALAVHRSRDSHTKSVVRSTLVFVVVIAAVCIAFSFLFPSTPDDSSRPITPLQQTINFSALVLPWFFILLFLGLMYKRLRTPKSIPTRRRHWGFRLIILALILFAVSVSAILMFGTPPPAPPPAATHSSFFHDMFLPMMTWVVIISLFAIFFLRLRNKTKKHLWQGQPILHRPHTLITSDTDLLISEPTASHRLSWSHFTRCIESVDLFILYTGQLSFHMIPKSAFPSSADLIAFVTLCRAHISDYHALQQPSAFPVIPIQG